MKIRSRDGRWVVETICLDTTGCWLRVKEYGCYVGQCRTPEGLAALGVNLADMEEVTE